MLACRPFIEPAKAVWLARVQSAINVIALIFRFVGFIVNSGVVKDVDP
jgi:hypothetical protein